MARLFGSLLLLAILAYAIWPYYSLYRIDALLQAEAPEALEPYVDLVAIQDHYRARLDSSIDALVPGATTEQPEAMRWLFSGLQRLSANAVEQMITLKWVKRALLEAAEQGSGTSTASLTDGVEFAFFESWDRFVVRLGPLGRETHVLMQLVDGGWRITDIID